MLRPINPKPRRSLKKRLRQDSWRKNRRLALEGLEQRQMMDGGLAAWLADGTLRIEGTEYDDTIAVRQANGLVSIDGVAGSYQASSVRQIVIDAGRGNDTVNLGNQPIGIPTSVDFGAGVDRLLFAGSDHVGIGSGLKSAVSIRTASGQMACFALHDAGELFRLNASGSSRVTFNTVTAIAGGINTANRAACYTLLEDGTLFTNDGTGDATNLVYHSSNVKQIAGAVNASGSPTVFALYNQGDLFGLNQGGSSRVTFNKVAAVVGGTDTAGHSIAYTLLEDGRLYTNDGSGLSYVRSDVAQITEGVDAGRRDAVLAFLQDGRILAYNHTGANVLPAATLVANTLKIWGTEKADLINVRRIGGRVSIDGFKIMVGSTFVPNVAATLIKQIEIQVFGGDS